MLRMQSKTALQQMTPLSPWTRHLVIQAKL
uniref:Uncharacterized protein n=1 Tax=Arundo donax TaxID=35708 RepID=A0A0A9GQJ2_ARUDO